MSHEVFIDGVQYIPAEESQPKPSPPSGKRWYKALDALEPDHPTGAWGKFNGGRAASQRDVDYNRTRLPEGDYQKDVIKTAERWNLPPWLLMGIFDRESNHGRSLDSRGYGDRGNAFGVGQVDSRYHEQRGKPNPLSIEHMDQCCEILTEYLRQVERKHPDWPDDKVLKGAVVAYNSGVSNVHTIEGMDRGTTGNDYGADTCARAQIWKGYM